ncbi:MAG: hypothetical protein V1664_00335 [Candidatus Uhrbacteria bacterium]
MFLLNWFLLFLHRRAGAKLRAAGRMAPEKIADEAVTMASAGGWKIHIDPEWRRLIGYEKLPTTEQDRIFNEVICTALITVYAGLDETIPHLPGERRDFWRSVRNAFYPAYQRWQKNNGIVDQAIHDWKKLFDLRFEEYHQAQPDTYEKFRDELPRLRSDDDRQATVRVMTLAAMTMLHVNRGQKFPNDLLSVRCLQKHLGYLAKENWRRFGW